MILWMAFSAVFALLVSLSARAAEVAARGYSRAVRGIWAAALAASALLPVLVWLTGVRWPGLLPWADENGALELSFLVSDVSASTTGAALDAARSWSFPFDRMAQALWLLLSLIALCWFCWAWRRLVQARASWRPHVLRDQRVLLSATSGPAVVGFYRPSIVVPRWVLTETASVQRMILLHEQEHARSGDHVLLALAPLLLVALPWNLPLWWQAKRLRLAIELDCDARVLRHGVCPREYGTLLLELAGAHGPAAIAGASLVEPRTFLERRIIAMSTSRSRPRRTRAAAGVAAAVLLAVAACESTTAMAPSRAPEPKAAEAEVSARAEPSVAGRGPLLVVDGVSMGHYQQVTTAFKRMDVESVEILKGEAALARFGEDGREGVIIVATRNRGAEREVIVVDEVMKAKKIAPDEWKLVADEIRLHVDTRVQQKQALIADGEIKVDVRDAKPKVKLDVVESKPIMVKMRADEFEVTGIKPLPLKLDAEGAKLKVDVSGDVERSSSGDGLRLALPKPAALQPLLYIDGREVSEAELRSLKPDVIDSIEVVKGTRATDLYGERGRNGVILIRTKGGS